MGKFNILHGIGLFLALVLCTTGCRSKKELVQGEVNKCVNAKHLKEGIEGKELRFEGLKMKAATESTFEGQEHSFKTNIRIRKDSLIWLSISKAGIQGFKVLISQDSLKYIDYIKNEYFIGSIADLSEMFHVSVAYQDVEDLLVGNAAGMDHNSKKYKVFADSVHCVLSDLGKKKLEQKLERGYKKDSLLFRYYTNPTTYKIERTVINSLNDNVVITMNSGNFEPVEDQLIPTALHILLEGDKAPEKVFETTMKCSKIRLNGKLRFPFSIPEKFTQISLDYQQSPDNK